MEHDQQVSSRPLATALLVGNPRQGATHPELPPLPGTEQEIDALRKIYDGMKPQVLTRTEANPARVIASLRGADIVHLAVHAVADRESPAQSRLVLSPSGKVSGDLTAREILRLHLPRTRLVMMAACEISTGPVSESEGSLGLASAFLTAGVPAVVGSLWKVNDSSTTRLALRFHEELRGGADALAALRTAQLQELAAPQARSDWTWASFEVFGGSAERPYSAPPSTNLKISW
jgi:CHAT domain-containing protein